MNILELLNRPVKAKGSYKWEPGNFIDSGYQAQVYRHPRDPNKVIKTIDVENPEFDSYLDFIKLVMNHQDNIFFPRIYSAKLYRKGEKTLMPDEGEYRLVVVMEKLYSIDNPKLEDAAIAAFVNLGIPEKYAEKAIYEPSVLWDYMEFEFSNRRMEKKTRFDEFKKAFKLLEPYISEYGQDMHAKNFMLRLTGHGPQLVIIDPLAPSIGGEG